MANPQLVRCAGAVVRDAAGRLLLIRRGTPPAAGSWSLPGGRVEAAETVAAAAAREVSEETGLQVRVGELLGTVLRDAGDGTVYAIEDFRAELLGGRLRAGDDAAAAGWFDPQELRGLQLSPGLAEALADWGEW